MVEAVTDFHSATYGGLLMNRITFGLAFLLLASPAVHAQEAQGCPQLPADSNLAWQHQQINGADFCRALDADGSEALGMYISAEPTFEPDGDNSEEQGVVGGYEVQWYRAELATKPGFEARETLIKLDNGRVAHVWLQAPSGDQLQQALELAGGLRFNAGRQVVAGP